MKHFPSLHHYVYYNQSVNNTAYVYPTTKRNIRNVDIPSKEHMKVCNNINTLDNTIPTCNTKNKPLDTSKVNSNQCFINPPKLVFLTKLRLNSSQSTFLLSLLAHPPYLPYP